MKGLQSYLVLLLFRVEICCELSKAASAERTNVCFLTFSSFLSPFKLNVSKSINKSSVGFKNKGYTGFTRRQTLFFVSKLHRLVKQKICAVEKWREFDTTIEKIIVKIRLR